MKKLYLLILLVVPALTGLAQDRTCATMTSLEERMKKDPSLRKVHEDHERATQEWIKANTVPQGNSIFPAIPGFTPTGNREVDQQNYAAAKAAIAKDPELSKKILPNSNHSLPASSGVRKKTRSGHFVEVKKGEVK